MQKELGKILLKDRYQLLQLHNPWPAMVRITSKSTIQMDVAFPYCEIIDVAANRPPPGVVPEELEKPLAVQDAEVRARRVFGRLVGRARAGAPIRVT